jgi:hypothetical protein
MAVINPPWRFDPLQMPVNVSWGAKSGVYLLLQLQWRDELNIGSGETLAFQATVGADPTVSSGNVMSPPDPTCGEFATLGCLAGGTSSTRIGYWQDSQYVVNSGPGVPPEFFDASGVSISGIDVIGSSPESPVVDKLSKQTLPVSPIPGLGLQGVITGPVSPWRPDSPGGFPLGPNVVQSAAVFGEFTGPFDEFQTSTLDGYGAAVSHSALISFTQYTPIRTYVQYNRSILFLLTDVPTEIDHPLLVSFDINGAPFGGKFSIAWQATIIPTKDHAPFPEDPITPIRWNTSAGLKMPFCLFQINNKDEGSTAQVCASNPAPSNWAFCNPTGQLYSGTITLSVANAQWWFETPPMSPEESDAYMVWLQDASTGSAANYTVTQFALQYEGASSWSSGANGFNDPSPATMKSDMLGDTFDSGVPPSFTPPYA